MDKSGASAYVYAKACGILARSFTGERAAKLFSVHSLSELWALIFKTEVPSVPEMLLAKRIEQAASEKFISDYKNLLSMYDNPDDVLIMLLQYFDYSNLKSLGAAAAMKQKERPFLRDITPYNILNYKAWPSIQKMTERTKLSWYNKEPTVFEQQLLDTRIDKQFVEDLWRATEKLPASSRKPVEDLILKKYSVRNMIWVLRLRVFYKMQKDEIAQRLAFINPQDKKNDVLAKDAFEILDKNIERYEDWANWKYARFLNPHEEGSIWCVDPAWVEESAQKELISTATHKFHRYPFTATVLLCWFYIKLSELDYIRAATEALRLNVDADSAMEAAGIK